jgi:hypothetical protein
MWPCLTKVRQLRSIDRMRVSRFITSTIRNRFSRRRDHKLWPRSGLTLSEAESATRVACINKSESGVSFETLSRWLYAPLRSASACVPSKDEPVRLSRSTFAKVASIPSPACLK